MELDYAAHCLDKLGNPIRLEIIRLLVRAGPDGLSVGALKAHLSIAASTLSHHILHLASAGLIRKRRRGRVLCCTPNYDLLGALVAMLTDECCKGVPHTAAAVAARSGQSQEGALR